MDLRLSDIAEGRASGQAPVDDVTHATHRGPMSVLFVDLCGYTGLSETIDPEDLRDVMTEIFGGITRIVAKYEGHIDKLLGDAALVLFGLPRVHEDDPVRAIKAALEIHEFVRQISPRLESRTHGQLRMHSSVSTGVVVTGPSHTYVADSALGYSLNLASRLLAFAAPDQVVCTAETYEQAQGHFHFRDLGIRRVRGSESGVHVYLVDRLRHAPATAHASSGLSSRLVGRDREMLRLQGAFRRLQRGEGSVVHIRGESGTGKSRLVDEFRARIPTSDVTWLEVDAWPHLQNAPYEPIRALLRRLWHIEHDDAPAEVRAKIDRALSSMGATPADAPFAAALLGVDVPELSAADAECLRQQILAVVQDAVRAIASSSPTVLYAADLQWADQSSVDVVRHLLRVCDAPVLFVITSRPPFELPPRDTFVWRYDELRLDNLSPEQSQEMLASLLDTAEVPHELWLFLRDRAEGNPFYLQELVNALVESHRLVPGEGRCLAAPDFARTQLPLTILGVVAARLDRLSDASRRLLLEASVIGRTFTVDLLQQVTTVPEAVERLHELVELDLLRVNGGDPRAEYRFRHAMIQEVAYQALPRWNRRLVHERVARAMERTNAPCLPDVYESLAFHYGRGHNTDKAIEYLQKSAEKSFRRYAIAESYDFYQQAFALLASEPRTPEQTRRLIDVLNGWAYVIYDRGQMHELEQLLSGHLATAESLGATSEHAMWCVCYAIALHCRERFPEALLQLQRGLEIAQAIDDEYTAACARVWLAYTLSELGDPAAAVEQATIAVPALEGDPIYITEAYSALGFAHWTQGDARAALRVARKLATIAEEGPNLRALVAAHWVEGESRLSDGDFEAAVRCFRASIDASPEPWPSNHPRIYLAIALIELGRYAQARRLLEEVLASSEELGASLTETPAKALLGVTCFALGEMRRGMSLIREAEATWRERGALLRIGTAESILGELYLSMAAPTERVGMVSALHNIGFLVVNRGRSVAACERHLERAARIWESVGAAGSLGETYLEMSRLRLAQHDPQGARECARDAVRCFEAAGIRTHRDEAERLLSLLT